MGRPMDVSDLPAGKLLKAALTTDPNDPLRFTRLEDDIVLRGTNTGTSGISGEERVATRPHPSPRERVTTKQPRSPDSSPRDLSATKRSRPSQPSPIDGVATKQPLRELAKQLGRDPQGIKLFDLGPFIRSRLLALAQEFTMDEQESIVETVIRNLRTKTDPSEEDIMGEINDVVMEHPLHCEGRDCEGSDCDGW